MLYLGTGLGAASSCWHGMGKADLTGLGPFALLLWGQQPDGDRAAERVFCSEVEDSGPVDMTGFGLLAPWCGEVSTQTAPDLPFQGLPQSAGAWCESGPHRRVTPQVGGPPGPLPLPGGSAPARNPL